MELLWSLDVGAWSFLFWTGADGFGITLRNPTPDAERTVLMPTLIVNPGTPQAWEIQLKPGPNFIGRAFANDFKIEDASVSGAHCQIVVESDGVKLLDQGSTNGTFVNRAPVKEAVLQSGQTVHLGSVELLFRSDAPAVATGPRRVVLATPVVATAVPGVEPPRAPALESAAPRLRIASTRSAEPEPPPAPPAEASDDGSTMVMTHPPGVSPTIAPPAPMSGPAFCKYHPKSLARLMCTQCHKTFCDLCVNSHTSHGAVVKSCRTCGGECAALKVNLHALRKELPNFFKSLPGTFLYPFKGSGPLILIGATLLLSALKLISGGIFGVLIWMVTIGYLFSFMQNIVHSTASEDAELPDLPAMDELFSSFFRLLGTMLVSFGPALLLAYIAAAHEQPAAGIAMIPAAIFGCLYFPMAFLAVAMKDTVAAANPLLVIPSILKVPVEYIVAALLLAVVLGLKWLGDFVVASLVSGAYTTKSMDVLLLTFALRCFWSFVGVYLLTVNMRILGLLYVSKKRELGWFEH